jgi:RNA polymerase sigma-70 factor (ECF subfamily)
LTEQDDVELVRRMQRGDVAAAAAFVRRHEARLLRLARLWSVTPEDARDAVQEALLRGLEGIGAFRFRSRPLTWIVGTLRNVCAEQRRRQRRVPARSDPAAEASTPEDAPEREVDARGVPARIRRWLGALPPRQRDAVVLRVLEELSVRDAAAVMGCREGTVKALLHQGMARLRSLAAEEETACPID